MPWGHRFTFVRGSSAQDLQSAAYTLAKFVMTFANTLMPFRYVLMFRYSLSACSRAIVFTSGEKPTAGIGICGNKTRENMRENFVSNFVAAAATFADEPAVLLPVG